MIIWMVIEISTDPDQEPDLCLFETTNELEAYQYFQDNLCSLETHYIERLELKTA